MFLKLKLREKLLLIISLLIIFALFLTTILWVYSTNKILKEEIITRQQKISQLASRGVEELIQAKLTNLILNSHSVPVLQKNLEAIKYQFQLMFLQDSDLLEVSFIDADGKEKLRVGREKIFPKEELRNLARDPVFVVPIFRFATEYIGPVYFRDENTPVITISVPILAPEVGTPALEKIRTIHPEVEPGTIQGVLAAEISLKEIMRAVAEIKIEGGSIYINEQKEKRVIAHTEEEFVGQSFKEVEVLQILEKKVEEIENQLGYFPTDQFLSAEGKNERGVIVLATHLHLPRYGWGMTVQQPRAVVFAKVSKIYFLAGMLFVVILFLSLILTIWFSNKIIRPIRALHQATGEITKGNYNYRVQVKTNDELEQLAEAFNKMAEDFGKSQAALEEAKTVLEIKVQARTKELRELTERQEEIIKERTKEIQERMAELERFQKLAVGRELRMIELKKESEELKKELNKLKKNDFRRKEK